MNLYSAPTVDLSGDDSKDATYEPRMMELRGRIGRLRYLAYCFPLLFLTASIAGALTVFLPKNSFMTLVAYSPMLAVTLNYVIRRLHDMDHSAWLSILMLIPFINGLFGLWLLFARGTEGRNSYGAAPSPNTRGLIVFAFVVPGIFIIGILAAVAIPAYSQYTKKAKANAAQSAAIRAPVQLAGYRAPLSLMSM